ncbi:MAG: DUF4011 domain-containing protein [Candidatus Ureaplasma intestinipullorum]|uniref:DUF4011 domain-containing protein n=1 Tax=Candidatus Ureaplasma intestinipullorum TaxID=2838770 RepID=A0A9E2NVT4_9BACT|nr:DUF4011 domain-containing protein [Candidatus Ureaplasma intestinipullorum]
MIDKKQNGEELFLIDNEDFTENLSTDTKSIKSEQEVQLTSNLNLNIENIDKISLKSENNNPDITQFLVDDFGDGEPILYNGSIKKDNRAIKIKLANLTTTNPKDMCIKAKLTKDTIDVSRFVDFNTVQKFIKSPTEKIEFSNLITSSSDIDYYLSATKTPGEFLACLQNYDIPISESKKNDLYKDFNSAKAKIIQNISNKTFDQKRKFDSIIRKNKNIVDNTGVYSLYLATNFLVGCTKTGVLLNSPIILFQVEMNFSSGNYILKHSKPKFVVNEKLLTLLKKEFNLNWIVSDLAKIEDYNTLLKIIQKDINIPIKSVSSENHEFKEFTNSELSKFTELEVYDSTLLGIYEPSGGALKENLERLVDLNIDPFISKNEYSDSKFINQEINGEPLIEIGRPLNIYQKYAIRSALYQNTLIYGPPGTGKSEVIANIIANAIVNLKTVLVVSEKKAALNVLHDRLQHISKLALFIYDLDDKRGFYEKIAAIGEKILNMRFDDFGNVATKDFDLKNKIESSTKWQKVQNAHLKVREYINKLIKLNNAVDSLGTTFTQYINANANVDKKLLKYAKDSNIIDFIESLMRKYSFTSTKNFFAKFNEYKDFLLINGINENTITNTLKEEKLLITKYQLSDNLLQYIIENEKEIPNKVAKLTNFFEIYGLKNDEKFNQILNKNPHLLAIQQVKITEFINQFEKYYGPKKFMSFLIEQFDQLQTFLDAYNSANDPKTKYTLLFNFINFKKISKFKPIFKGHVEDDQNELNEKLAAIKAFVSIPHARYTYLYKLADSKLDFIDKNIVIIYRNQWMLKQYIIDLGIKSFTFFDEDDVTKLTPVRGMDGATFDKFKIIINFENEIMNQNKNLMYVDVNELINIDRNIISNVSEHASQDVESYYLEYLNSVLSKLSQPEWNKVQEVISIARRSSKKNASIKDFVQQYHKQLSILFPIWISLPELVAQMLPLEKGIFDYGIFDEASQMFVERAYPIVYRCNTNIVAGDDKQLKPTSFFASRINESDYEYSLADNDQVDSLLDRAKVSLWASYNLRNHYRSEHRDLIQFSNDYVYDNNLHFATKNGVSGSGIEVINVENGISEDSVNEAEAQKVIQLLSQNINKYNKIIVITFGSKQSLYIEQLLFKNSDSSNAIYKKFLSNNLVITNLENVQGNEGDLVILSTTFGISKDGLFKNSYGPLIMDGGINRLNVAITRAKEKMIIVKSISATDMNINYNNPNALVLKSFFEYCDKISEHRNIHSKNSSQLNFVDSIFKVEIGNWLLSNLYNKKDIEIIDNYDIGSKIIDFAIVNKKTQKVELAIVINKWSNKISLQNYLESIDNYFFFIDRGYKTIRIEEYAWVYNNAEIKKQILSSLENVSLRDYFENSEFND